MMAIGHVRLPGAGKVWDRAVDRGNGVLVLQETKMGRRLGQRYTHTCDSFHQNSVVNILVLGVSVACF